MVSTRQSSNVASSNDNGNNDSGGIRTRHSAHHSQSQEVVPASTEYVSNIHFLDLPIEIFDKIFSYTGYRTVSQVRLVCRQLDKICGSILNSAFQKLQTQMLQRFQSIKARMPRRESARRNHPLACESDIVETLHMRLTLLQMSFGKHIERKHCCFFAGEILDEVYKILHYIEVTPKLNRPYRVTDELFDLSTMAMEYFKEHIEPTLPEISYFGTDFLEFTGTLPNSPPHTGGAKTEYESPGPNEERSSDNSPQPQSNIVLRKRIRKIKLGMKKYNSQLTLMKRELRSCKSNIAEQNQQFLEYASRLDDYDKKNEETSRKFSTLLQELNKCKTELQYWRSKSPLSTLCMACGKSTASASTEELQMLTSQSVSSSSFGISFDESLPSTSTSTDETPLVWGLGKQERATEEKRASEDEEVKTRQSLGSKRKSICDETPATHTKKSKKPRVMLKVRSKRS